LPLVMASFRDCNCSYRDIISRMSLKLLNDYWLSYMQFLDASSSGASGSGKSSGMIGWTSQDCVILGFHHEVEESCAFLGYYAVSSGNSLPTFWDNLLVPSSMVRNYYYMLRNNPEECSFSLGRNTLMGMIINSIKVTHLFHYWLILGTFGYDLVGILG
jgi:hypothetical protein